MIKAKLVKDAAERKVEKLNREKAKKAFTIIAKRDGVSVGHVRAEIQRAIDAGMANPDPRVQAFWKAVPHTGERPSPEDVICL